MKHPEILENEHLLDALTRVGAGPVASSRATYRSHWSAFFRHTGCRAELPRSLTETIVSEFCRSREWTWGGEVRGFLWARAREMAWGTVVGSIAAMRMIPLKAWKQAAVQIESNGKTAVANLTRALRNVFRESTGERKKLQSIATALKLTKYIHGTSHYFYRQKNKPPVRRLLNKNERYIRDLILLQGFLLLRPSDLERLVADSLSVEQCELLNQSHTITLSFAIESAKNAGWNETQTVSVPFPTDVDPALRVDTVVRRILHWRDTRPRCSGQNLLYIPDNSKQINPVNRLFKCFVRDFYQNEQPDQSDMARRPTLGLWRITWMHLYQATGVTPDVLHHLTRHTTAKTIQEAYNRHGQTSQLLPVVAGWQSLQTQLERSQSQQPTKTKPQPWNKPRKGKPKPRFGSKKQKGMHYQDQTRSSISTQQRTSTYSKHTTGTVTVKTSKKKVRFSKASHARAMKRHAVRKRKLLATRKVHKKRKTSRKKRKKE